MDMVERVARAIDGEAWKAIEDGRDKLPDSLWYIRREVAQNKAKAAIQAMREPTGEMKQVGVKARWQSSVRDANNVTEIYQAMIDAALKESK